LPETGDRIAEKVARMIVPAGTAALWVDLVEDSWIVVARSLDEIGSASWRKYSSWFSLVGF
jgi:hypothetical protein